MSSYFHIIILLYYVVTLLYYYIIQYGMLWALASPATGTVPVGGFYRHKDGDRSITVVLQNYYRAATEVLQRTAPALLWKFCWNSTQPLYRSTV